MTAPIFPGNPVENRPGARLDSQGRPNPQFYEEESFRGDYQGGSNLIYAGYARPGADEADAVWQIFKCSYDGNNNILTIKWPEDSNGHASNDYIFTWDAGGGVDHTTYTYS